MSDNSTVLQLSPEDFSLSDYDNVRITLPEKPSISSEDVDAQLFGFVLSTGRSVNSIDDLDDEWVKGNFEGLSTIEDVRQAIVDDYERNLELEYSDMKYRACCDALVERLQGEVDEAVVASNVESMRQTNQARLEAMHMSFEQYLRDRVHDSRPVRREARAGDVVSAALEHGARPSCPGSWDTGWEP